MSGPLRLSRTLGDGHVQSHVREHTEWDDYITIHRVGEAEPAEHYNDWHLADENANEMQEVYEIVDANVKRFIPLLRKSKQSTVLAKKEIQHRRPQMLILCRWISRSERSPPICRSPLYMVDEKQLDRVENIPERELSEMCETLQMAHSRRMENACMMGSIFIC